MRLKILPVLCLFAVVALGQDTAIHEAGHTATSVTGTGCVLSTANNGQRITLHGKAANGAHDLMLEIPGCTEAVLLTFAGNPDSGLSATELRRDGELRRFQKYTTSIYMDRGKSNCMDCRIYGDVEADLTGKLEIASVPPGATRDPSGFLRDKSGKFIGTSGWGHPGPFARYRLVIVSVSHVTARKLPSPK